MSEDQVIFTSFMLLAGVQFIMAFSLVVQQAKSASKNRR